jgi:hypothetical protein
MEASDVQKNGGLQGFLRDQLRNIAPVFTLLALFHRCEFHEYIFANFNHGDYRGGPHLCDPDGGD